MNNSADCKVVHAHYYYKMATKCNRKCGVWEFFDKLAECQNEEKLSRNYKIPCKQFLPLRQVKAALKNIPTYQANLKNEESFHWIHSFHYYKQQHVISELALAFKLWWIFENIGFNKLLAEFILTKGTYKHAGMALEIFEDIFNLIAPFLDSVNFRIFMCT